REAFWPVDHLLHACAVQRWDALERLSHVLLKVIVVVLKKLEGPFLRNVTSWKAAVPSLRIGLIASQGQAPYLLLEVDPPVGIAHCGHSWRHALDGLCHDVLMLHGLERHENAREGAHLPCPLPRAVDHQITGDGAGVRLDRCDPLAF